MRYMMFVKADENGGAGGAPSPELMAAIGKYAEDMTRAGVLLEMGGLLPSAMGAQIHVRHGLPRVVDGPFTEAKEVIGGYAIVRAASRDEAIEHGWRFMSIHVDVLGPDYAGVLEIRQLEDAGPETHSGAASGVDDATPPELPT